MNENKNRIMHRGVNVVASGYEWTCPNCGELNKEYEYRQDYFCSSCCDHVETASPEHAMG